MKSQLVMYTTVYECSRLGLRGYREFKFFKYKQKSSLFLILYDIIIIFYKPNTYNIPSLPPKKSILQAMHGEESIIFIVGNFHVWLPELISSP
jgi:hypothetical protein